MVFVRSVCVVRALYKDGVCNMAMMTAIVLIYPYHAWVGPMTGACLYCYRMNKWEVGLCLSGSRSPSV